jgi:formate C-acetyltransferase
MTSCIENAMDITEGGGIYNSSSFGMSGLGTLVDSLFAIKNIVYKKRLLSLCDFAEITNRNFLDNEILRQYILNKIPKYGQDDPEIIEFASTVLGDLASCIRRYTNARNGYYEASLFSFYSYSWLKDYTGATFDGRTAGKPLSRGINPSESTTGIDAATLVYTQRKMDYSKYPGGAVLYMDLPLTKGHIQSEVYKNMILYFLQNNGCMMDFNVINREQLLEAQREPENHKNINVRICGYSAPFYLLDKAMQDEVIERVQR